MAKFYIKSDKIFLEDKIFNGYVKVEDEKITEITNSPENGVEVKDYTGKIVAPGYFDTHIHGYHNHDIMDADKDGLLEISKGILANGVTSFLATTLTDSVEKLNAACENVKKYKDECEGAKVQGIFLEGPFFTEKHKGAQNTKYMSDPSTEKLDLWQEKSGYLIKKIAIAPEREHTEEFISYAVNQGVKVALGHSDATYEQAKAAIDAGANIFVHTYNGMSPLHHRNPGMVGAAFTTDAYSEVICDGHHLHPAAVDVVIRAKSTDKTLLITDCMMAGGMPEGNYKLGEFDVVLKNGAATIENGSLAGSVAKLNDEVKNVYNWGLVDKLNAVKMASLIPARSVGLDDEIGSIKECKFADINILDDELNVLEVYVNGQRRI